MRKAARDKGKKIIWTLQYVLHRTVTIEPIVMAVVVLTIDTLFMFVLDKLKIGKYMF